MAAVAASYLISRKSAHSQTLSLVLTGSMIMALCNAGVTMIKYVADPHDVLQQITFWLMGSLTKTSLTSLRWSAIPMVVGLSVIGLLRWRVNLQTLDEEEARSLGISIRRYRVIFIAGGTQITPELAVENGADAGFGRGTKGIHDATFMVKRRRELEAAGKWPR